jgi:hypothetical protein
MFSFSRFSRFFLNYQKNYRIKNFKFDNMTSHEEQPAKKIRLNSGEPVVVLSDDTKDSLGSEKIASSIEVNQMIREREVGIIEYANPSIPGFLGVIKQR